MPIEAITFEDLTDIYFQATGDDSLTVSEFAAAGSTYGTILSRVPIPLVSLTGIVASGVSSTAKAYVWVTGNDKVIVNSPYNWQKRAGVDYDYFE